MSVFTRESVTSSSETPGAPLVVGTITKMQMATKGAQKTDSGKKKARFEYEKARSRSRINIMSQIDRWFEVKQRHQLMTHADTAKFLLDR